MSKDTGRPVKMIVNGHDNRLGNDDIGNAARFVEANKNRLAYVTETRQWLSWKEGKWSPISYDQVLNEAETVAKGILKEVSKLDRKDAETLGKWAIQSRFNNRLKAMVELARGKLTTSISEFDNRELKLNCKNGVLDFDKSELGLNSILVKHNQNMLMTKQIQANYNPSIRSDEWESFIDTVFGKDKSVIEYLKKALGYSLLGTVKEQCAFFAYGLGANGKSTLFETVKDILGDYAKATEVEIILSSGVKQGAREKEAIGRLHGTRYAIASEANSDRWLNAAQFKQITGGDTLTGAKLYGDQFDFQPTFKLWLSVNHLPRFKEGTDGLTRRVRVIPFKVSFKDNRDKNIKDRLWKQRDGILTWLVEGAIAYLQEGLPDLGDKEMPVAIKEATEAYIFENDTLRRFIEETLNNKVGTKAKVSNSDVYKAYLSWCEKEKVAPIASIQSFARYMKERISTHKEISRSLYYLGYELKAERTQPTQPVQRWDFDSNRKVDYVSEDKSKDDTLYYLTRSGERVSEEEYFKSLM